MFPVLRARNIAPLLLLLGLAATARASGLPVIPGAEGFGIDTPAGRGGAVHLVTTLADDRENPPAGSLRACVEATGRRVCVFEVAGAILLDYLSPDGGTLELTEPYLTIAGQTAPAPGITILGTTAMEVRTHDVLVQHLRIRPGDPSHKRPDWTTCCRDGFTTRGEVGSEIYNVVFDHLSVSWGVDENHEVFGNGLDPNGNARVHDVTVRSSISAEGLHDSIHESGPHSMGALMGNGVENVSLIGNLYAHNGARNPQLGHGVSGVVVNNLVYDWGSQAGRFTGKPNLGGTHLSFQGNVYIEGPQTIYEFYLAPLTASNSLPGDSIFVDDNRWEREGTMYHYDSSLGNAWGAVYNKDKNIPPIHVKVLTPPVWPSPFTPLPSAQVEGVVLASVGARPADRDAIDERMVTDVTTRSCLLDDPNTPHCIIDSQAEVGGWPAQLQPPTVPAIQAWADLNYPTRTRTHTLPTDPSGDDDADGYTNLEEWLHLHASMVEDPLGDPDGDTLTNQQEWDLYTLPDVVDSDGDGWSDPDEVAAETDPANPLSHPITVPASGLTVRLLLVSGLVLVLTFAWRPLHRRARAL